MDLLEQCLPGKEALQALLTETCNAPFRLLKRLLFFRMRLRIKLVGIADKLFLKSLWKKVAVGQRQVLCDDFLSRETSSRMSFADARMTGKALSPHHLRANQAMAKIRLRAEATDARCVTTTDAYVVKHRSLLHEAAVELQFRMRVADMERPSRDQCGVDHQNIPKPIGLGIIFVNDEMIIHILWKESSCSEVLEPVSCVKGSSN